MIKEALQYIIGLGNQAQFEVNGQEYSNQQLHLIPQPTPKSLVVRSLSGFVEYLKSQYDTEDKLMVHVESPTLVTAFDTLNNDMARSTLIKAEAMLPEIRFGQWYDAEDFNIKLQSMFVNDGDRAAVLKVVGNIKEENVSSFGDDGVSQQVTAKTGVATVENVKVPNPVGLYPYRTFVELRQPLSLFVFRMRSGPTCAMFDADGGSWKVEAMDTIREYLNEKLKDEIESGKIVLIA